MQGVEGYGGRRSVFRDVILAELSQYTGEVLGKDNRSAGPESNRMLLLEPRKFCTEKN
jgi:hypothetical protein